MFVYIINNYKKENYFLVIFLLKDLIFDFDLINKNKFTLYFLCSIAIIKNKFGNYISNIHRF